MEILKELLNSRPVVGRVEWIGIAKASRDPMQVVQSAKAIEQFGLDGEHHGRPNGKSKRQVTFIQQEHLACVQTLLGDSAVKVDPGLLRRNVVVSGINLSALRHLTFQIGTAVFQGTGSCPPCSRMDENLGKGGYAAMLGHGGITAIVLRSGPFSVGDQVQVVEGW